MDWTELGLEPEIDASLPAGSAVVLLRGIVDLQARPALAAAAAWLVMAQPHTVCVDLSAATYFGAEGLRFLANLSRCRTGTTVCEVTVASPSPTTRRALEVTGFAQDFGITAAPCQTFTAAARPGPVVSVLLPAGVASSGVRRLPSPGC